MLYLDALLPAQDFRGAVNDLAAEFRERHRLGRVCQLGLVVASVEAAAEHLENMGFGPFLISSGNLARWDEGGKPGQFRGKLGIAKHQGVDLELLEPGEGSDFYRRDLDPEGRIVVQHLGFFVNDVDRTMAELNASGCPTLVRGRIKAGPLTFEFAYLDTIHTAGIIIELINLKALGLRINPLGFVYHFLGRLEKLSGIRCVDVS